MPTGWQGSTRKETMPHSRAWWRVRWTVLQRDGHRCQLADPGCLVAATEVDHIGDRHDHRPENLRAVCRSCHQRRSSRQGGQAAGQRAQARVRARKRPPERHPGQLRTPDGPPPFG